MFRILKKVNTDAILQAYQEIEDSIVWTEYNHKGKQAGIQYRAGDDPWNSAVGTRKGNEMAYAILNSAFTNTIFDELINEYNLKRSRLMWVYPFACYSMHRDQTARIHIPLITNSECYFVFKNNSVYNLPLGNAYIVNTRQYHTFMNCSAQPRLHLVGSTTHYYA